MEKSSLRENCDSLHIADQIQSISKLAGLNTDDLPEIIAWQHAVEDRLAREAVENPPHGFQ